MRIVRPAVRVFAVGDEFRPTAFLFNTGERTALFEFRDQLELDELSLLMAGQLELPTSSRLKTFIHDNDIFEELERDTALDFYKSAQSRQLSYFACSTNVVSAVNCLKELEKIHVWIIGVGGVGCHLAEHLARIGVKNFSLVDPDIVEESNLNRQILYGRHDLGKLKTEAAKNRLEDICGESINVSCYDRFNHEILNFSNDFRSVVLVSADSAPFQLRRDIVSIAYAAGVAYAFLGYIGQSAFISPFVFDQSGGCGSCATVSGQPERWLQPLSKHKAFDVPPSSYATNAILSSLAVDLLTRSLMRKIGGVVDVRISMEGYGISMTPSDRDPNCPVCGK